MTPCTWFLFILSIQMGDDNGGDDTGGDDGGDGVEDELQTLYFEAKGK